MKGSLRNASQSFICRCYKADSPITDGRNTDLHLDIGNGVSLEKVDKFCYVGFMLDADGGYDSAITAKVRSAWKKFREYLPILTGKGFSLKRVYCITWEVEGIRQRGCPKKTWWDC